MRLATLSTVPEYAGRALDKAASDLVVLTPQEDEAVLFQARLNDVRVLCVRLS